MTTRTIDRGAWIMRGVLLIVGLGVLLGGLGYGLRTSEGLVGAGLVPAVAGFVMALSVIAEAVRELRREPQAAPAEEEVEEEAELDVFGRSEKQANRAVVNVFLVILGTTVLAYVIGLLLALTAMVFTLLRAIERQSWVTSVIGAVLAFLFGYLVFGVALGVPLPTGMLGWV